MKRVVVTGTGCISSLGSDWAEVSARLKAGRNAIVHMQDWDQYEGLFTRLGGPAEFSKPAEWSRKAVRSMGRVAMMAVKASEQALAEAGLLGDELLASGDVGVSYGSSAGSTSATADFGNMLIKKRTDGLNATSYIRMMSHTCPVNIGVFFGIKGRIYTTSSACTSSSQGIGYGYEAIRNGLQTVMVCGGAEELCPTEAAVFDTLYATSTRNDQPSLTPRPFDQDRDGLVIGEGACTLVLEELEHARARGATIYAEVVGFATNSDGAHVTQPDLDSICVVLQRALDSAGVSAADIGYISAHGTATERGDIAESQAVLKVLGDRVPISALKSYTGHTLGACGSLEAWVTLNMMREGWFHPTLNLDHVDERCAPIDYIAGEGRDLDCDIAMSNNFAFGGINTSLIFKRI
ncbi:beta-ketoacyl-ACP synthase [Pseudohalioglobus lutimaris]|uniref:Beta-ketoacyl-ACP synthase II n=1 Tax=Pseudohalioglobus lutimaris TaxID=1737061 RepID=A0A2N5WZI9_9GAMM|nr:beta-ketoacyl-ACP synthase [Pseudohalioglobus lutimaris]PLW67664.1 beta-ketoacyl-ACP synthase II [Pseudohalioglobus lutimaris]